MKSHRGEAVVRDVLEATRAEVARVGYRALRIEDVALRAEVAKTTIYRRWPSKEDLVFDLLQSMMDATHTLPEVGSLREGLLAIARQMLALMESPDGQAVARMMMAERTEPEIGRIVERLRERNQRIPVKILERARARGEVREGIDPELLLMTLVGSLHHRVFAMCADARTVDVEALVDLLLHGASTSTGKR